MRWIQRALALAAMLAFAVAAGAAEQTQATAKKTTKAKAVAKSLTVMPMRGNVVEGPLEMYLLSDPETTKPLRAWLRDLDELAEDAAATGIILNISDFEASWAQRDEIAQTLDRLVKGGKTVVAYLEEGDQSNYWMVRGCSRIVVNPLGELDLRGLSASYVFVKGLLDWIGVQADLEEVGAYKGAAEPLTLTASTPQMREEMNSLLDGLYGHFVAGLAKARKVSPEKMKQLIDQGPYTPEQALKAGLIDQVADLETVIGETRQKLGEVQLVRKGETEKAKAPTSVLEVLAELFKSGKKGAEGPANLALVYIDGTINSGESEPGFGSPAIGSASISQALRKIQEDDSLKGVVIRIDSPGGSALASEVIWQAAHQVAAGDGVRKGKPVVVSVGGMAASGGYYIASAGQHIFCEPSSIVGSIGVVGGKFVLKGLFTKIGINTESFARGARAELLSSERLFTPEERKLVRDQMLDVFKTFKDRIKTGRAAKIKDLDKIADGRVFVADQALKLGLVDEIGGLKDAIDHAAKLAGVEKPSVKVLPEPRTFLERMLEGIGKQDEAQAGNPLLLLLSTREPLLVRPAERLLALRRLLSTERTLTLYPHVMKW